ncbi:MAG: hypothetical protein LBT06_20965 [Hungatella sp.]|jgi:chromosome segregation ATPase|nr:hypothetical protein [Hungatella sp.]
MKPRVSNTDENVKKIRDEVIEKLVPGMKTTDQVGNNLLDHVGKLVTELEFQKRLRSELSATLTTPDYLLEGINSIYQENAVLIQAIRMKEEQIRDLSRRNRELGNQLDSARKRIRELEPKCDQ